MEDPHAKCETTELSVTNGELPGTGETLLDMTADSFNQSSEHDDQCQDSSSDPRCDSPMGRSSCTPPPPIGIRDTISAKYLHGELKLPEVDVSGAFLQGTVQSYGNYNWAGWTGDDDESSEANSGLESNWDD